MLLLPHMLDASQTFEVQTGLFNSAQSCRNLEIG